MFSNKSISKTRSLMALLLIVVAFMEAVVKISDAASAAPLTATSKSGLLRAGSSLSNLPNNVKSLSESGVLAGVSSSKNGAGSVTSSKGEETESSSVRSRELRNKRKGKLFSDNDGDKDSNIGRNTRKTQKGAKNIKSAKSSKSSKKNATTASPTTAGSTTASPTISPTTSSPTESPTTPSPTESPTTPSPTESPTTPSPTQSPTTPSPTESPTTDEPTYEPTTTASPTTTFSPTFSPTS